MKNQANIVFKNSHIDSFGTIFKEIIIEIRDETDSCIESKCFHFTAAKGEWLKCDKSLIAEIKEFCKQNNVIFEESKHV